MASSEPLRVCRFRPHPPPDDPTYSSVPDDGLCLNVFLLLTDRPGSDRILLGQIDPAAAWPRIGGMSAPRIARMGDRWMLPSRQLFLFESPDRAAESILLEQLGVAGIPLAGPRVTSEAWQRPEPAGAGLHWDLSFLYRGTWPKGSTPSSRAWRALRFWPSGELPPDEVGRSHLDVLALAGFPVRSVVR